MDARYKSISRASQTGNIAFGFRWRYFDGPVNNLDNSNATDLATLLEIKAKYVPVISKVRRAESTQRQVVEQTDPGGEDVLRVYETTAEAAGAMGYPESKVFESCLGERGAIEEFSFRFGSLPSVQLGESPCIQHDRAVRLTCDCSGGGQSAGGAAQRRAAARDQVPAHRQQLLR